MSWQTLGINGSKFETLESRVLLTGSFPSAAQNAIVYDSKGNLDVAYYDSAAHNLKYVQESPSGSWSAPVTIDGSSSDVGQYVAIALNAAGQPAVAYQDSAHGTLKFAQSNGSSWLVSTPDTRKTTGFNPSLTFDGTGHALISYYKQNTGDLMLATQNGKKWTLTTLQSKGNVGQFSSIAINPSTGKPAVAYTNAAGQVQYVSQSGKTFSKPATVANVTGAAANVSLAFNGGSPTLGFIDSGSGKVELASPSGKTFATATVGTVAPGQGSSAQVFIDPTTNKPAIVYHDTAGVYLVKTDSAGTGFDTTQVQTGGKNSIAAVQLGSGAIVFSTVDTSSGTLSVTTTTPPPTAPTHVAAAAASTTSANITWTDTANDAAGFLIERSADGVTFTTAGTVANTASSFTDTGLTEGTTYYYRVSAIGALGNNSAGTTTVGSAQVVPAAGLTTVTTLAAAPSGIAAVPASATSTTVTWTNNSAHASGFIIQRSTDDGTTWTAAGTVVANVTSFTDTALTEATAYSYLVSAFNVSGATPAAASASTHTLPAAPSSVVASAASTTVVNLTWHNNSSAATAFIIQRSTDGVSFSAVASAGGTATSYTDSGLTEASAYYYKVLAVGPGGLQSVASSATNAMTNPNAPSNLAALAKSSTRIDLSWANNTASPTSYIVQRSSNAGTFATVATLAGTAATYSDTGRTEGVSYSYRVEAITRGIGSAFSPTVTSTTLPAAPTALSAVVSGLAVTLVWSDNSNSETSFQVQRSLDNGATWQSIGTVAGSSASTSFYVDNSAGEGATCSYRVNAINAAGHSANSNAPSVTLAPAAPTGLTATASSSTQINLAWTDHSLGETGILIERSADGGSTWVAATTTGAFATTYQDTGLTAGATFNYRISAINGGGASSYSTAVGITAPAAPSSVAAVSASNSEIDLSWPAVSGATSYLIQRSPDGSAWTQIRTVTTTSYTDLNLAEATQFQYTVTAIDAGGSSLASTAAVASTRPSAPSSVTVHGLSPTSVSISWVNTSRSTGGFVIQRSIDGINWSPVSTPANGQSSDTDLHATEGSTYTYRVQAVGSGGGSTFATSSAVTTVAAAPTGLSATAVNASTVNLAWTNNSSRATSIIIQRSTDGENFTQIGQGAGTDISFTDQNASAATLYWYRVYAVNAGGTSDYSNSPQATTTPAAPANLVATGNSATSIGLTWNSVNGAADYNILRSANGETFSPLDSSSSNSYTDATAVEGTRYWYAVVANNTTGTSVQSTVANVTTVPSAPSSLAVASTTSSQVTLNWSNTSHAATNFKIERSDDNGTSFSPIGTAAGDATSYPDTTVGEGSHFIYRVRATGPGGDSAASNTIGANTAPAAPASLSLAAVSPTSISVSWANVSTHATGYVVSRSSDNGSTFSVVQTLGAGAQGYTDTVSEGTAYQYEIRATQLLNDNVTTLLSAWTGPRSVSTLPAAPSGVQAISVSASQVDVSWVNHSTAATSFKIYRGTDSQSMTLLGTSPASQLSYHDLTAAAGTQYFYAVAATGPTGDSQPSASSPLTSIPAAPSNVQTSTAANPTVSITWNDVAGETGFKVYRSTDGSNWTLLNSTGTGITHYTDATPVENVSYQYAVKAFNGSGDSAQSDPGLASTFLAAPNGLTLSATASQVSLSWTDHSSSATAYEVQRQSSGGSTWQSLTSSLGGSAQSYVDSTVADGVTYSYRVRALHFNGNSDFTQATNTTTALIAPTNVTATTVSSTEIDLAWSSTSSSVAGFQIFRSGDNGSTFQQIDAVSGTTFSYQDQTVTPGGTFQYKVVATNSSASPAASSAIPGTALATAPTNLHVTPVSTTSLSLTWTVTSTGATGYEVFRSLDGISFSPVTTVSGANANSYTDSGLTEGTTYVYQVVAVNHGGSSPASNVSENVTYCAAPTSLAATATSAGSIGLTWANHTQGASGYAVAISTDNGATFSLVTASLADSATAYSVGGLNEATAYQFQVYAYNGAGPSAVSNTANQTTLSATPTLTSVAAQADGVHVAWQNNSTGATGFTLQRGNDGGSTFDTTFALAADRVTYIDTSALANTTYTYRVVTNDAGGSSAPSTAQSALTLPGAPTNVTASSNSSSSTQLSWTVDAHGAAGYVVKRSIDGADFSNAGTALGSATTFTDTHAVAGVTYKYQVFATNTTGSSAAATSPWVSTLTGAPTGLAAGAISATSVALAWNDVSGETGFVVQRSTDNSSWTTIASPTSGQTHYTDTDVTEAATFYYRVAASNASGTGDFATSISALTLPASPGGLTANPISATQVNLTWTNVSHNADGITLLRSTGSGPFLPVTDLPANATSYPDQVLSGGTSYSYKLVAFDTAGSSLAATQTALTLPAQPQDFTAVAASSARIDLTWSAVTGAAHYTISRSLDNSSWTQLAQLDSEGLSYQDTHLASGTLYYYRVVASNASGAGQAVSASTPTLPASVTSLQAASPSATHVDLTWTDSAGATAYNIYRSTNSGQSFTLLTTLNSPTASSYGDTVAEGTAYTYRVTPVDASGEGAASDTSITTVPATPILASATPNSAGQITVGWTNDSAHATGFTVMRTPFGQTNWSALTSQLGSSTVSFADSTVSGGTQYTYKVVAQGAGGPSADSNTLSALTVPSAITTLSAASVSTTEIDLSWTSANGASGYKILRSANGETFAQIGTASSNATSYQDIDGGGNTLAEGTRYYYQVLANDSSGDSAAGNVVHNATLAVAPTALTPVVVSDHQVDLSWTNHSSGANDSGVGIERSTNGILWSLLTTAGPNASTYHDTTVSGGTSYQYRVSAIDEGGTNYMADHSFVTALTLPSSPTLAATPINDGSVSLSWSAPTGAAAYTVQRSTDGSNWATIVSGTSSLSIIDGSLNGNSTYQYHVLASNATGDGAYSTAATTLTVPTAPSNVTASSPSTTGINLSWTGDAGVTFNIYRQSNGSGPYLKLGTVNGATTFNDTGLTTGATYAYEVFAANASGQNVTPALSGAVTTLPAVPASVAANPISATRVDITWSAGAGATSYTVSRSSDTGSTWTVLTGSPLGSGAVSYSDMSAASGTSYTYKVTAINSAGSQSSTATALTYPAVPGGLTVTVVDNHDISVHWNASTGATSYTLQRASDGVNFTDVSGVSGTGVTDTVAGGGTYTYRVKATDATGDSAWAADSGVTTVPDAPSSVAATVTSDTAVHISWSLSDGALHYVVRQSTDNGIHWHTVGGTLSSSTTSYDDTGLAELTAYKYEVIASNAAGNSAPSVIQPVVTKPTAPSALHTTAISSSSVSLAWTDNAAGQTGFDVQRSSGDGWTTIGSTDPGTSTYTDSTVAGGSAYNYRVIANNGSVTSAGSTPVAVLTLADAPTHVVAAPASASIVNLSWTASNGSATYTILRSDGGGSFAPLTSGITDTSYSDTSALGGTAYAYEVIGVNATGSGLPGTSSTVTTVPAAQSDFAATPISTSEVDLSWTLVTGATTYTIARSDNGGAYATLTSPALDSSTHAYHDTTVAAGTHYSYQIFASDATGDSVTTTTTALTIPSAVSSLSPSIISDSEIMLTWTAPAGTVDGYRVYRSINGVDFVQQGADISPNILAFDATGLTASSTYTYKVLAFNATGPGAAVTTSLLTTKPTAPTDFTASAISSTRVDFTWTDVTGATSYQIESTTNGSDWSIVTSELGSLDNSYSASGLAAGTNYTFRIEAINAGGQSVPSATRPALTMPAAPASIVATPSNATTVVLTWHSSISATRYNIRRSVDGGSFSPLVSGVTDTTYTDNGASGGTTYEYQVIAVNASGSSAAGASDPVLTIPAAQGDFAATVVSATRVDLSWTDVAGATSYTIERRTGSGDYAPLTDPLGASTHTFSDTTGAPGTAYDYRIVGTDATGASAATTALALTPPAAVAGIGGQIISSSEIDLSWSADAGVVSGYRVLRSPDGVTFTQTGIDLSSSTFTFHDTSLSSAHVYLYDIVAFNTTGASNDSYSNSLTTLATTPTNFTATAASNSRVDLAWTLVSGATGYQVETTANGTDWTTVTSSIDDITHTYAITELAGGTTYTYRIEALDAGGASIPTDPQHVLTKADAPTTVVATPRGAGHVSITWDAMPGAATYTLFRDINGGSFDPLTSNVIDHSYSDSTIGGTTYAYKVEAINSSGASTDGTSASVLTVPDAQSDFAASVASATRVNLSWTDVAGATSYTIQRRTGSGDYATITDPLGSTTHAFADTTASTGTSYTYKIVGTDATGDSVASTSLALTLPAAVSGVSGQVAGSSQIDLSWSASTDTISGYRVFQSADGISFTQVGGDLSPSTLTYSDTDLTSGHDYLYKVVSFNTTGQSADSFSNTLTTLPATPANFTATGVSSSQIDLAWDLASGATQYEVDGLDGSTWAPVNSAIDGATHAYSITGLTAGTAYTYRVIAIDAGGPSIATSGVIVKTRPDVATGLVAAAISSSQINLTWNPVASATRYSIYRSTGGGFTFFDHSNTAGYSDSALSEGSNYAYKIVATNESGDGAATTSQSATTYLKQPALAASGMTATGITLTWTNHSSIDTGYMVEQQTGSSTWSTVASGSAITVDGDTDFTAVTGLTEATTYTFRVTALGSANNSLPATLDVSTAPNNPAGLTATPVSTNTVNLSWTNNSASADNYQVQRSTAGGGWVTIFAAAGNATSYSDTTCSEATTYQYRVAAYKGTTFSAYATSATIITLPSAPSGLSASAASPTQINLEWTNTSGDATANRVYRSINGGASYSQLGSDLSSSAVSYSDSAAPENATTYYYVVAVDAAGESAHSEILNATTPLAAPASATAATSSDVSSSDKTIDISWTNTSTVASNVSVERSSNGTDWTPLITLASTATTYSDTSGAENTAYTYRVWAVDGEVSSTHTASNSINTLLSRPTGVSLSSPTATSVTLTWTDVSSAATSYRIERSADGSSFTDIGATASGSDNTFTDSGRTEGTQYWYRVRARSGSNASNYSDVQSITTLPAAPSTLAATPFSNNQINLTWVDASTQATSYTVERSVDGAIWTTATSGLPGNATSYHDTGRAEATDYDYRVFAVGAGGASADSNTITSTTKPNAPTSLAAVANSATSVALTWNDNSSGETAYEVQRSTDGISWSTLTTSLPIDSHGYTDTTAVEGTAYQYQVRAGRNGTESVYSTAAPVTTPPAAPSGLVVSSSTSNRVTLTWSNNSTGENGFRIDRSTDGGSTWTLAVGAVGSNSFTYSDNAVTEGVSYTYRVYAYNTGGSSAFSNAITANIPPTSPNALTATSVTPTSVALSWTNRSSHQTGFYVQSSTDGGTHWLTVGTVTSGTTFTDTTNTESTSYQYRVQAYGATGTSTFSGSIAVTTPLNAPTLLTAATISTTEVDLAWVDNSGAESGYSLQRSSNGGATWTTIPLAADTAAYADTGRSEGVTYTYRVRATRTGANSAYTSNTTATTLPAAPSAVGASAASDTQVTVIWTNNSVGATGFTIERSLDGSHWTSAGTVDGSITTFTDSGLTELTTYFYHVKATNAGGASAWAAAGSSVTTLPAAPAGLILSAPAADRVALNWTNNTHGATAYKVDRIDNTNGGSWTTIVTLSSSAVSYTDLSVAEATNYSYRVRAVAGSVNSAYCPSQSITTVPLAPDTLAATAFSTSRIDLTWNNSSTGATHYLVERSNDGGTSWTLINTLAGNATTYSDTGLTEATPYQYRVRAQDAGGFSGYAPSVTGTTLPQAPTSLAANALSGHIDLTWSDNSTGETGYTVQRLNGGIWTTIGTLGADSSAFSDTGSVGGLSSGTTYQFRVFCTSDGGNSANSNTASAVAV